MGESQHTPVVLTDVSLQSECGICKSSIKTGFIVYLVSSCLFDLYKVDIKIYFLYILCIFIYYILYILYI